jgi:uncharacterized membrane protein
MPNNTDNTKNPFHIMACVSLIALIVLLVLWEMLLAPLRPNGSWMVLKVIPLLFPLRGIFLRQNYTMQWSSMLILLYFTEGVVRASSDTLALSRVLAGLEIIFSVAFFFGAIFYVRPYKKIAKELKKKTDSEQN